MRLRLLLGLRTVSRVKHRVQMYDSCELVDVLHSQSARQAALDDMEAGKACVGAPAPAARAQGCY